MMSGSGVNSGKCAVWFDDYIRAQPKDVTSAAVAIEGITNEAEIVN